MIKYVKSLPWKSCKSLYQVQLLQPLPQVQKLQNFIAEHNITDVFYATLENYKTIARKHQLIVFVANSGSMIDIVWLDTIIQSLILQAKQYFYLAVNKFFVYTLCPVDVTDKDFDTKLIDHWQQLLQTETVWTSCNSNDQGQLGNFVHPVTNMMFKL
jgi:hypothetical protein